MASKYKSSKTRSQCVPNSSPSPTKSATKSELSSIGEISEDEDDPFTADLRAKTLKFSSQIVHTSAENIGPAPFHFEKRACDERAACDYSQRITIDIAKAGKVLIYELRDEDVYVFIIFYFKTVFSSYKTARISVHIRHLFI